MVAREVRRCGDALAARLCSRTLPLRVPVAARAGQLAGFARGTNSRRQAPATPATPYQDALPPCEQTRTRSAAAARPTPRTPQPAAGSGPGSAPLGDCESRAPGASLVLRYLTVNLLAPVSSCECCSIIDTRCMPLEDPKIASPSRTDTGLPTYTRVSAQTTGSPNMLTHNRQGLDPSRALRRSGASNAVQHQCPSWCE
jgi:hypothetical protein